MSSKTKFVQNSIKNLKIFCYLVNKIAKKSRFLSKSYGSGERIRISKDPSILTDPDPFGQKNTDPDPDSDPRNPAIYPWKFLFAKIFGAFCLQNLKLYLFKIHEHFKVEVFVFVEVQLIHIWLWLNRWLKVSLLCN